MRKIFDLEKKYIIVTGASGLLGKEHCKAIAEYNGNPILIDTNKETLSILQSELYSEYSIKAISYLCDITNEESLKEVKEDLIIKKIPIYGLINNAARNPKIEDDDFLNNRLENLSLDNFQKDLNVGLIGSTLCAKYFGILIANNPEGGTIINISSDLGLIAPNQNIYIKDKSPEHKPVKPISYSIVKTGIIGLTRYLATYWNKDNVRCNALCPGGIENNQDKEFREKIETLIPLGRMAKKDEYKSTIIWMLSPNTSYLNGAIISVDGGRTVW